MALRKDKCRTVSGRKWYEKMYLQNCNEEIRFKGHPRGFRDRRALRNYGKIRGRKSTLLSLISGLDLTTSGLISYNGKDMRQLHRDRYRAADIGVIFQGYNLLTNTTAMENVEHSMHISGTKAKNKRKAAYAMLEQIGIDRETADRKSGGEQQRVGIARALSHDPALIIADEPTGNLDGDTEENIMGIFQDIAHEQGKCVIIVTHSDKVAGLFDYVHYLEKGN